MKTIINKMILLAIAVVLTYCTPIEQDKDTLNSILETRENLTQAESYFQGDKNEVGVNVYDLRLMTKGVGINYKLTSNQIGENAYKGTGYVIFFDLNTDSSDPTFPMGTFVADKDDTYAKGTFSNAYVVVLNGGATASDAEKVLLTDGSINVSKTEDTYIVSLKVTTISGVDLDLSYTGKIDVSDPAYIHEPMMVSTRNFVASGISYDCKNIDSDRDGYFDMSLSKLTLTSDSGVIVIDEIPDVMYALGEMPKKPMAGTYTLTQWTYEPFTFTPGEIYDGDLMGSYAWLSDGDGLFSDIWYLTDATMTVTEDAKSYSIAITGTSVNGSTITVQYTD
ncbi:MAG: hypothetical protein PHH37_15710 [Paludibacter sp.]|nr:hypothetical protein [Paludibacter sp.]